jgi:hypothetical protein
MYDNHHISQAELIQFQNDLMDPQEKIKFLEHISTCDFCAEQFADGMIGQTLTAPPDLKGNLLSAVKRPEIQIARKVNETSKRMQLLWYSIKVGTAAIGAFTVLILAMNFSNNMPSIKDNPVPITKEDTESSEDKFSLTTAIKEGMNSFSNSILDFSNNILQSEVNDHDKKEK